MSLPTDARARKALPLCRGVLDYFPDALLAVAELSRIGNEQHNPGEPMHWAKEKSTDEADALLRHLIDRGKLDTDGVRHSAKVAWRALALLQREIDADRVLKEPLKELERRACIPAPHPTPSERITDLPQDPRQFVCPVCRQPGQLDVPSGTCKACYEARRFAEARRPKNGDKTCPVLGCVFIANHGGECSRVVPA